MNWRNKDGLSLMELLVALVLVAVITGALATSTRFGVQLLDRTQDIQETSPQIALRTRLRHWLGTAIPPSRLTGFPAELAGTENTLSFTTLGPMPFAPRSAALRISIDMAGDDMTMTIQQMDDDGDLIATETRILAAGVENGQISYYEDDLDTQGWQNTWDNPARLPSLIMITADEGSTPPWPEFTVKLSMTQ